MKQYVAIINYRTLVALTISILTPVVCYNYNINYNIDLTLISIAIVFPLVFTIRSSFRRREKALEHLRVNRNRDASVSHANFRDWIGVRWGKCTGWCGLALWPGLGTWPPIGRSC